MATEKEYASEEQRIYARWLDIGTKIGFAFLVVSFAVYVFGFIEPHIAHGDLPARWNLPVDEYLLLANVEAGWGWLRLVHRGDFLNLIGVAWLSTVTLACYLRLLPVFAAKGDRAYLAIAIVEIVVLLAATSGLLVGGH
jgi:hypothetical protein